MHLEKDQAKGAVPPSTASESSDDAVPAHMRRTKRGLMGLLQWYLQ